jgi:hypothetical protein
VSEVILVGCSAKKLDHKAKAKDLYRGNFFRAARAYVEAKGLPWVILSALHGVVLPDHELEPYECSLNKTTRFRREEWGRKVQGDLHRLFPGAKFIFLAGEDYSTAISGLDRVTVGGKAFDRANPLPATEPLSGLGIGQKIAMLKRLTRALTPKVAALDVEASTCDFCGEERECAVSEQGHATPARPEAARICGPCASWALDQFRAAVLA